MFQLVLVNRTRRDEDNPRVLGPCCWVLNDGCQVLFIIVNRNTLVVPGHTGIIGPKEDCLCTHILLAKDFVSTTT